MSLDIKKYDSWNVRLTRKIGGCGDKLPVSKAKKVAAENSRENKVKLEDCSGEANIWTVYHRRVNWKAEGKEIQKNNWEKSLT